MTPRLLIALPIAALILSSCKGNQSEDATSASAVDTATIRVQLDTIRATSFEDWKSFPTELRGIDDVQLTSGAGGRALSVSEVGTSVQVGQALCDIESDRYAAMLAQAQSALDLANGELERTENNVKAGSVGKAALDKAKLDAEGAKVQVLQAKRVYQDSRCESPISGVLANRSIERYQTVGPGMPTVRVARTDRLEALVSIPEADVSGFTKGTAAQFTFPGLPGQVFEGRLRTLDLSMDSRTRTATGRIEITNRNGRLHPGMSGKAQILHAILDSVLIVPTTSVLRDENGPFVMVAQGGIAHRHRITLGPSSGDSLVVLNGIAPGSALVVTGAFRLNEGSRVSR